MTASARLILAAAACWLAQPAVAQTIIDGDSLRLDGTTYRLYGIDAPDDGQVCRDGWPAAYEARSYLEQLVQGREITCQPMGLAMGTAMGPPATPPGKGETDAICRADGVDVGAAMVTGGMAFAHVPHSARYISQEDAAAQANRGVHRHKCLTPWEWRARLQLAD